MMPARGPGGSSYGEGYDFGYQSGYFAGSSHQAFNPRGAHGAGRPAAFSNGAMSGYMLGYQRGNRKLPR
jgi:hypothetical protein